MSGHTHTPAEWAASGFLGLVPLGALVLVLAFADADPGYFDPRPAVRAAADRVLVEVVNVRLSLRDAALSLAALSMLLSPAAPEASR